MWEPLSFQALAKGNLERKPHPSLLLRFSLRLGHARGLTVHRTVIQRPCAASLLAAARSRFGSCVINAIHYRNAASLPARRALPSLLGKVAAKPTDEATSRVQRKSFNEVN